MTNNEIELDVSNQLIKIINNDNSSVLSYPDRCEATHSIWEGIDIYCKYSIFYDEEYSPANTPSLRLDMWKVESVDTMLLEFSIPKRSDKIPIYDTVNVYNIINALETKIKIEHERSRSNIMNDAASTLHTITDSFDER